MAAGKNKKRSKQSARFVEAAHELGVDESEAEFKEALGKIARAAVPPEQRKKPKRKPD